MMVINDVIMGSNVLRINSSESISQFNQPDSDQYEEFILDMDGKIIDAKLSISNITGYNRPEIIGKNFSIFYSKSQQAMGLHQSDLQTAAFFGFYQATVPKQKKDNTSYWANIDIIKLNIKPIHRYILILRNAHDMKMKLKNLRLLGRKSHSYFNNVYTGIFRFNLTTGLVTLANDKAIEIFGIKVAGDFFLEKVFLNKASYDEFVAELKVKKKLNDYEFQVCRECEGNRWVSISCQVFAKEDYVEGILLDITIRKNQVLELQRLNDELDRFIYHASHDLRSPLTSILGLANLLEMEQDVSSHYGGLIKERVEHLDELLKELVELTRNNKTEVKSEIINFSEILTDICLGIPNPSEVLIETRLECLTPFYSDSIRLKTILRNLISNAVKYHNHMEDNPYVIIDVTTFQDRVIISVRDNGIGIAEESIKKLFTMFFRATSNASGSGLGLFIVNAMLSKLGGTIKVSSTIDKGSEFLISLPNNR